MLSQSGGDGIAQYEVLSHTADTGIATRGASLEEVIGNAAVAMFDLMYDLGDVKPGPPIELTVDVVEPPDLLVSVLGELLYHSEAEDVAFSSVEVRIRGDRVVVMASAVPVSDLEPSGPPIKAVTYHDLRCEPTDEGWRAQVIFDV